MHGAEIEQAARETVEQATREVEIEQATREAEIERATHEAKIEQVTHEAKIERASHEAVKQAAREAEIKRTTRETEIALTLCLEGGAREIATGIGFFDHMLNSFAVHGGFGLRVQCRGDLEVDGHHTVEDVGIVLGQALAQALGDKAGIARFGSAYVPMDEALGFCALDCSGRPYLVFSAPMPQPVCGDYDTCLTVEFMRALAVNAGLTLHLRSLYGDNAHHITEALFKALARALRQAVTRTDGQEVLSAKGVL